MPRMPHQPAMNASPGSGGATRRWNSLPSHAGRYSAKYTQAKRTRIAIMLIASAYAARSRRSEEHTSELQSRSDLVCRLLLEKKKENLKEQCQISSTRVHGTDD